ncbi:ABC transporter permease [Smaragdicoccus niigatensis]|uniref:ABC transporter permease n=1 Tax=Smaragdicoccus niigatensis TaxID=359359 RepID=UPI00035F9089|nr:FtsX-like permease family protein [Smaragdicoccus niigatensis]
MIWKISLRNLAAHKVRLVLTLLAVVLGTAFVAGSFVFTDSLKRTFDGIFENLAKGVDVRVSGEGPSGAITLGQVPEIRDVPGVAKVAPSVRGSIVLLDKDNKPIQNGGAVSEGMTYLPRDQAIADQLRFVAGRPPQDGEVALNTGAARLADLHPGDSVRIVVNSLPDPVSVKLSGIYEVPTDTGGYVGAVFEAEQAKKLFTDGSHVAYVDVAGKDVSPAELRDRIQTAFPGLKVQTGDEVREELRGQVFNALRFINYFLFAFGVISLTVATFIIYNTFSMIVAQRLGELALLRATGASRAQIRNSVALEATVIGVLGSIIGLFGGIGLAYGLRSGLNAAGFALPSGRLQLTAQAVVLSLAVGIVVTVISAYAPARRASKISPIEAMRMEFSGGEVDTRSRTVPAVVIAAVGVVVVLCGAFATTSTSHAVALVAIGAAWLILAGTLAAESVLTLLIAGLGYAVRPFGTMGAMGRRNAIRNPRRTIATASALTLGLMLVSVVGILGASAKASVNSLVDNGVTADFVLSNAAGGPVQRGIPTAASKAASGVAGVRSVTPLHQITTAISGTRVVGTSTEGDLRAAVALKIVSGSGRVPAAGVLLSDDHADGRRPGDVVEFANPSGAPIKATIAGIYERNPIVGDFVAGPDLYNQLVLNNQRSDAVAFVSIAPDAVASEVRAALEDATAQFYVVQVLDPEQFKGTQAQQIDTLLGVLYGLLGLAVIIGILGIVNTLALSVVERRREIGMLRAVGMLRVQIRRIIYVESVLIALAGAIVGVVMGVPLGVAFVHTLASQGLQTTAVPWVQVAMMLVASAFVGVLAALWPATRAARTSPLEAIVDI